jgi:methylated-DNA-[protein]-cysteine S-methyltransferase
MAWIASGETLRQLTFGHGSAEAAVAALGDDLAETARAGGGTSPLVRRLQAYASGVRDEFRDVEVDPGPLTEFQRRVLDHCRRIPYGRRLTYGELATRAGYPGAARAVGRCMASNRVPLIVPCHRVVAASGGLGGYSARGGLRMKRRLLELEAG